MTDKMSIYRPAAVKGLINKLTFISSQNSEAVVSMVEVSI